MTELPFGFGGGPGGPSGAPFFAELEKLLSWQGGPVNWELARQVAVRTAGEGDRAVSPAETHQLAEAVRLAELWLDPVTALPAGTTGALAWSRVGWVEATLPVWQQLCDPVAGRVAEAMRGSLESGLAQLGATPELAGQLPPGFDPAQLSAAAGPFLGMINQLGGLLFGAQVGQALGTLAREVLSATEIGLPLGPAGSAALLPGNLADFGAGLSIPAEQVRLYLALRETAHQRLFGHVGWLRGHLLGAVEAYARGIAVDPDAIGRALTSLNPMTAMLNPAGLDPEQLAEALGGGVFSAEHTPEQQVAVARLETLLALVEGWVDAVADRAAADRLPAAAALRETVRRRRASGGPAEQTFAALVGLELRPRRLRDAAALWDALLAARGIDGRDAVWDHPDLLPGSVDLDDPAGFVAGGTVPDDLSGLDGPGDAEPGPAPAG
jgi:putative hydrolase